MSKLIFRKFIKDYKNYENNTVRESYGIIISIIGILCNCLLFCSKLIIGTIIGSISIMTDSFNNLSDSASSIVSLVAFKIGSAPADSKHPFGYSRVEYMASFIISITILILGFEFCKSSIDNIIHPSEVFFEPISVCILFLGVGVKIWLSGLNSKIGKKINSTTLIATGIDARNDCIISSITIFSILFTHFTSIYIDGYIGVAVSALLLYSGFRIARETISQLLGEAGDPKIAKKIQTAIVDYEGVIGVHDLIIHNYGPTKSMATIHVEVPDDVNINISHELIDKIEQEISARFNLMLLIHMDPIAINDERIIELSQLINGILTSLDEQFSAHEFRLIDGKDSLSFIFDLEIPHKYPNEKLSPLIKQIKEKVRLIDARYNCVINLEYSYISR